MTQSVIVAGARTPIGRLLGGLKSLSGSDLGGHAIKGALGKAIDAFKKSFVLDEKKAGAKPAAVAASSKKAPPPPVDEDEEEEEDDEEYEDEDEDEEDRKG